MGCDIHTHLEIRCNGKWEHYSDININRWYALFGVMAGVRDSSQKMIVKPKGFPVDASLITRLDYERWGVDAHTPSWFNEKEIEKLRTWLKIQKGKGEKTNDTYFAYDLEWDILNHTYLFGNVITDIEYLSKEIDAVRLVFWFDN